MPVTSVHKDPEALTLTVIADFAAPLQRLWDAYLDPRQIERFWGPPTYPATFTRHDAFPGGTTQYFMTSPEGATHGGYWDWIDVKPPEGGDVASFEVRDGFSNADGTPNADMPAGRMVLHFETTDAGSRVTVTSHFNSAEELAQLMEMGQEEGMRQAMGQIDDVLADLSSFAQGVGTKTDILSDTQVRITRIIRGSVDQVWRAHFEPALLQQWMLGPDGWSMPVCEVVTEVGATYRYRWTKDDGTQPEFGFTGELVEFDPPSGPTGGARSVTTETFEGPDGFHSPEPAVNELTLTPVEEGTLMSLVVTYPNSEVRDTVLATGMTDGMEAGYARLEGLLS